MALFDFFKKNKASAVDSEGEQKNETTGLEGVQSAESIPESGADESSESCEVGILGTEEIQGTEKNPGQDEQPKTEELSEQDKQPKTEEIPGQDEQPKTEELPEQNELPDPEETPESDNSDKKVGMFKKILAGLSKTRNNIMSGVDNVLKGFVKIDDELFEELMEVLIMSDVGVETSDKTVENLKSRVKEEKVTDTSRIKDLLCDEISKILQENDTVLELKKPAVILVIGVNGVGKTTTIGKLAANYKREGRKVLLAAADTFRAAAIDQLEVWGTRSGIEVIKHQENSDPGAVVFDAIQAAKARKTDLLICDTAGRLHNKKNLMEELKKIFRIISQNYPEAQLEVFLVLDATTGQNALQQARIFKEAANITGIVLTKLDGTAKGGIVIAIKNELGIPVRFVGVGEGIGDLQHFDAADFAKALFAQED